MHQFQRIRIFLIKINTGNAGVMHLLEEFFQVSPTFMIYPGIRKKTTSVPILKDTDTEINILPKTHL